LALLLTAMTEDLPPPPPHASPQTLPVPGGPLPHATREEEEEAASPPVPQVPPPEPPSVHASAHYGAPLSPHRCRRAPRLRRRRCRRRPQRRLPVPRTQLPRPPTPRLPPGCAA
jgi:hypothetical protein